jgi:hypothetical protein
MTILNDENPYSGFGALNAKMVRLFSRNSGY